VLTLCYEGRLELLQRVVVARLQLEQREER
jgi:hypothetical protein